MPFRKITFFLLIFFSLPVILFSAEKNKLLERWDLTMKYGISSQRLEIIRHIEINSRTNAYYLLELALTNDDNPNVKISAANSMMNIGLSNQKVWQTCLNQETNSEVLRTVAYGTGYLKIKAVAPRILELAETKIEEPEEERLTTTLIQTVGELEYEQASDFVHRVLTNNLNSDNIRSAAAMALGSIGNENYLDSLEIIVNDPGESKGVRMYAAYAIGKTGADRAADILIPIIDNENEDLNIRLWSLAGLAFVSDEKVVDKLIGFARLDNIRIRIEAIKALGKIKDNEEVVEILKYKAQYDPQLSVKKEAKKSLLALGIDMDKKDEDSEKDKSGEEETGESGTEENEDQIDADGDNSESAESIESENEE